MGCSDNKVLNVQTHQHIEQCIRLDHDQLTRLWLHTTADPMYTWPDNDHQLSTKNTRIKEVIIHHYF